MAYLIAFILFGIIWCWLHREAPEWLKALELAMLLLFGSLFGLLLGIGLNPDLRRYTLMALCLFIAAACVYYIASSRKR